jgi:hypothetical protein
MQAIVRHEAELRILVDFWQQMPAYGGEPVVADSRRVYVSDWKSKAFSMRRRSKSVKLTLKMMS